MSEQSGSEQIFPLPPPEGFLLGPEAEALYNSVLTAFADTEQNTVHVATLEGDHIQLDRASKVDIDDAATSIGGLIRRLAAPFRKPPHPSVSDPYRYTVTASSAGSNEQTELSMAAYNSQRLFSLGKKVTDTPEGSAVTRLDKQELIDRAAHIVAKISTGEIFDADVMLDVEQLAPCSTIQGAEALRMYGAVMPTVHAILNRTEGLSEYSDEALAGNRVAIRDTMDDLPVDSVGVLRLQDKGDALVVAIAFRDHPFVDERISQDNKFIVVMTQTTRNGKQKLAVSYKVSSADWSDGRMEHPIALDVSMRARVLENIRRQVRPDNLRDEA